MDIKNIERAGNISDELKALNKAIEQAYKMLDKAKSEKGLCIVITEYSDFSGLHIPYQYTNGYYNKRLYKKLINSTIATLEEERDELLNEIKSL